MKLHWLDVFSLITYLFIIIAVGIYFSRKNTTTEGYFVGNRSYSGWVIGLSMISTSISSITFLAYPADSFKTSWLRFCKYCSAHCYYNFCLFIPPFLKEIIFYLHTNILKIDLAPLYELMVQSHF